MRLLSRMCNYRLVLIIAVAIVSFCAEATTIRVPEHVKTIRAAIDQAVSGDTIIVRHGTYREGNLIIQKSITLLGNAFPVIDGEYTHELFTIASANVTVQGFKFINTGVSSLNDLAAVKCLDCKNVSVLNNIFENTFFAIHFSNSSHSRIAGNQISAKAEQEYKVGNGIHLWKCHHVTIHANTIQGHRDGIYFEFVTDSFITSNESRSNLRYGLHFMFSHNDEYRNNIFSKNGAGVAVMYTQNVKMYQNTFEENWGSSSYGMLLKDIRDSHVEGNVFIKNTSGIYMEGSSRTLFIHNIFRDNGWAIKLQASCDDNIFEKNNFINNSFDVATNGTTVLNTMKYNYWDKYEGYDLNKDRIGDVPYRPVNIYSMIVERIPTAVMLWRSFLVLLLDRSEKVIPAATPTNLKDDFPMMIPYDFSK